MRDRAEGPAEGKVRFTSSILPRRARRSRSLDTLLPILYLRAISTGDVQEALSALLGENAPNLSPGVLPRLTRQWEAEDQRWQECDLSARRYVFARSLGRIAFAGSLWADGVYLQARMEHQAECMLVLIGATPEGRKERVGVQVGMRESARSWRELRVDIEARGLASCAFEPSTGRLDRIRDRLRPPEIAVGDGALG